MKTSRLISGILLCLVVLPLHAGSHAMSIYRQFQQGRELPEPAFHLPPSSVAEPLDYNLYGEFLNPGTDDYLYAFKDREALMKAVPMGIYPSEEGIYEHPDFAAYAAAGKISKKHWEALGNPDPLAAFFSWATAGEETGVKTYFTAVTLERAGHILPALKAYHAVFTHFPRSPCFAPDGSYVWYPAQAALGNIRRLCREYPQLGLWYEGGSLEIINGYDPDTSDDIIKVTPGRFVHRTLEERQKQFVPLENLKVVQTRGEGKVRLVQYENGHWQMIRDGKPFFIQGVTYMPTMIGLGPKSDTGYFHVRWMYEDHNGNGIPDIPYETWIDANRNGVQDENEPPIGDFQILKDMGCNAIRIFNAVTPEHRYDPTAINKEVLRDLWKTFGIQVIMGDHLGAYTVGSGATWEEGTDYRDPVQRERMKQSVREMVMDLKDEPFILMWVLGNENNMQGDYMGVNATRTNAGKYPDAYASLLNEVAEMIHTIDPNHPVAVGNIGLGLLDVYNRLAPSIDIIGINAYQGKDGFGTLWEDAKRLMDRPVIITEYGCDAYHEGVGVDEEAQKEYLEGCHRDIVFNQAGGEFTGNAIGGVVFEFLDEWWKDTHSGDPENKQEIHATFRMPFPDGWSHEEWLGILGQGDGKHSPFKRVPRKAYYYFKEVWN